MRRRKRSPARAVVSAGIASVIGIGILLGLGVWQLERKAWKEALIANLGARLSAAPVALPPPAQWQGLDPAKDEYRRVTFVADFRAGEIALVYTAGSALRPDVSGAGYWVLSPARLPGGASVLVNRGFVPADRRNAAQSTAGAVRITGALRFSETRSMFTPPDEPPNNVWYSRDPPRIAAAKNWGAVAPFYIEQEAPLPPSALPRPGKLVAALPNNHLQYAITWFGLAAALAGVFLVWWRGRRRRG